MKIIYVFIIVLYLFSSLTLAQNLVLDGMVGFPTDHYAFSSEIEINNLVYGGSLAFEIDISESFSGYCTAGISVLNQSTSSNHSVVVPIMAGVKYKMGAGGFLPYLGAELGYNIISYHDYYDKEFTIKEPAVSVLVGLTLPLTSKIFWDISGKYSLVLTEFQSNSMISIFTGIGFALN